MVALLFLAFCAFAEPLAGTNTPAPRRIVSLAPSTTEILFAIGAGHRVVGVTRYCDYPPAAQSIAKVGGYVDPNYEAIVALEPDLVILLTSHREAKAQLEKMKLRTLTVPHDTIEGIHEAIRLMGVACGEAKRAGDLLSELTNRTQAVSRAIENKNRPRVLICIGRDTESGQLNGIYAAGANGFFDRIIHLAGGLNACADKAVAYPQLSAEGVIQLDPDVIVDLVSQMNPGKQTPAKIASQWKQLSMVAAVRKERVHVIRGDHSLRPGPRYIEFLEQLARLLHKDSFPGDDSHAGSSAGY